MVFFKTASRVSITGSLSRFQTELRPGAMWASRRSRCPSMTSIGAWTSPVLRALVPMLGECEVDEVGGMKMDGGYILKVLVFFLLFCFYRFLLVLFGVFCFFLRTLGDLFCSFDLSRIGLIEGICFIFGRFSRVRYTHTSLLEASLNITKLAKTIKTFLLESQSHVYIYMVDIGIYIIYIYISICIYTWI